MNALVFELLENTILSRALFTAAELDIAEHIKKNPHTATTLARATNTTEATLIRLLNFLCLKKIFTCNTLGIYELPEASSQMLADHPQTIKPFLLHDDETRWNSFGNLTYSITTAKPAFDMLYGQDYFTSLKQSPELSKRFDDAMNIISEEEDVAIAKALSLKGIVADIGGGNGQLIKKILAQQPSTLGVLFDLPTVVENITRENRLTAIGGSFFEKISIKADTFLLKRVLHDWNDAQSELILHNVVTTMEHGNQLWIIDGILDQAKEKTKLAAVDLALLTIFGGQERNISQFQGLIKKTGLTISHIQHFTPLLSGICCELSQKEIT